MVNFNQELSTVEMPCGNSERFLLSHSDWCFSAEMLTFGKFVPGSGNPLVNGTKLECFGCSPAGRRKNAGVGFQSFPAKILHQNALYDFSDCTFGRYNPHPVGTRRPKWMNGASLVLCGGQVLKAHPRGIQSRTTHSVNHHFPLNVLRCYMNAVYLMSTQPNLAEEL